MRHVITLGILKDPAKDDYLWYRREVDDLIPAGCSDVFVGGPFGSRHIESRCYHPAGASTTGRIVHSLGAFSDLNSSFRRDAPPPKELAAMIAHLVGNDWQRY